MLAGSAREVTASQQCAWQQCSGWMFAITAAANALLRGTATFVVVPGIARSRPVHPAVSADTGSLASSFSISVICGSPWGQASGTGS
jgi:hypothetical protein